MEVVGILSLIFGIIGLVSSVWYIGILPCVVGIVLGIIGLTDFLSDKNFAITGLLISILGTVVSVYMFVSDVDSGRLIVLYNDGKVQSVEAASEIADSSALVDSGRNVDTETVINSNETYPAAAENDAAENNATEVSMQEESKQEEQTAVTEQKDTRAVEEEERVEGVTQTSNMEVHFIDVGQGDCTLVKCGDSAMLIDVGDDTKGTAVQNYLQKQGITKLDYLILTHPDADHIGAAPVIITKFQIDTVFVSNYAKDNNTYRKLIQALDEKRLSYSIPTVGSSYALGSAKFTILAPNGVYDSPNNASIALLLQNGSNKFLFSGDAEEAAERDILNNGLSVSADVYQVGHHGSKTSSSQAFLNKVQPTYAVISCAEGNSYGHPHAQTLNTLRSMGVKVFRTDEQGSIIAYSDGKEITWNCAPSETWKAGEANSQAASSLNDAPQVQSVEPPIAQSDNNSVEVHITKTGEKYHSAGCQYLRKSDIVVTLEQAKEKGLEPCSKCNPPQ